MSGSRERKRTTIIHAALKLFARGGFEATSVDDIARETGFGKGTLYLYFKDKEDLYYSTLLEVFDSFEQAVRDSIDTRRRPDEILRGIAVGMIDFFAGNRDTFRLLHTMSGSGFWHMKRKLMEPVRSKVERLLAFEEEVIERGKAEGLFRSDIASRDMAFGFAGMVNFVMQSLFFTAPGEPVDAAERAEAIMRIFMEGVAGPVRARDLTQREEVKK